MSAIAVDSVAVSELAVILWELAPIVERRSLGEDITAFLFQSNILGCYFELLFRSATQKMAETQIRRRPQWLSHVIQPLILCCENIQSYREDILKESVHLIINKCNTNPEWSLELATNRGPVLPEATFILRKLLYNIVDKIISTPLPEEVKLLITLQYHTRKITVRAVDYLEWRASIKIFLSVLVSYCVDPERIRKSSEAPGPLGKNTRRSLVILGKCLQNIITLRTFGVLESEFEVMNDIISELLEKMMNFLENCGEIEIPQMEIPDTVDITQENFNPVARRLLQAKSKLFNNIVSSSYTPHEKNLLIEALNAILRTWESRIESS